MKLLKKALFILIAAVLAAESFGCAASIGNTADDNERMARRVIEFEQRMFVDDVLLFTQLHRPIRTSRWMID